MKVFIDTNVLIDFVARREQFYQTAANLINLGIKGELKCEVAIDLDGLVAEDVAELAQRGRQMDLAEAVALIESPATYFNYRVGDDDFD